MKTLAVVSSNFSWRFDFVDDDLFRYCAPPNQSDIQLRCGLPKQKMSKTDTHVRAIEGEANFNWRTIHEVELPLAEPLAQFKLQVCLLLVFDVIARTGVEHQLVSR